MTLSELIEQLQDIQEEHGGTDGQVYLAIQPTWPFEYQVSGVGVTEDGTVYIGQGAQMGYLDHAARVALDWAPEMVE